tara:strand:+ start:314 stop:580 length:267 start_codon:yes stop_codon:yes gene_type:complete
MSEEIKPKNYPDSPLGENDIITDLKNNIEQSPIVTYSTELLNDIVDNSNKKINDKEISLLDDYTAIFPLSVTLLLITIVLIMIYISFF